MKDYCTDISDLYVEATLLVEMLTAVRLIYTTSTHTHKSDVIAIIIWIIFTEMRQLVQMVMTR